MLIQKIKMYSTHKESDESYSQWAQKWGTGGNVLARYEGKNAEFLQVLNLNCEARGCFGEGWWEKRERETQRGQTPNTYTTGSLRSLLNFGQSSVLGLSQCVSQSEHTSSIFLFLENVFFTMYCCSLPFSPALVFSGVALLSNLPVIKQCSKQQTTNK